MLYKNARIFTSDPACPEADSMVVENGSIVWIGTCTDLPESYKESTISTVDLSGRRVIPGIVDAHMHPLVLADCMDKIACLPPRVHSIEELKEEIRKEALTKKEGEWICGWGFDEGKFAEHRTPTKHDLDEASLGHPVELLRSCSHIRSVNSKVLEIAGIDKNTPEVPGGEIVRDPDGTPNGILLENARHLVADHLPVTKEAQQVDQMVNLGNLLLSYGITAFTDMGTFLVKDFYPLFLAAAEKGLRQEMGIYYPWDLMRNSEALAFDSSDTNPEKQIHKNGLKLFADGSVAGQTAWMSRNYLGTDACGMPVCSDEELDSAIAYCKEHHLQLSIHAMGEKAIDRMLDRLAQEDNWMETDVPYARIEHVTEPSDRAIGIAKKKGIAYVTQPIFFYSEIESYLKNLGPEWTCKTYPVKKLLDRGVKVALSTDSPATSWATMYDPFVNMMAAVTRTAYDGTDCGQEQAIDIRTALELYTRESSMIAGFSRMGMLKPGYKANFAVLSEDVLTVPSEQIGDVKVLETYIGGECVYRCN